VSGSAGVWTPITAACDSAGTVIARQATAAAMAFAAPIAGVADLYAWPVI
jgi:membrane-bound ClpP family serine protease